MTHTDHEGRIWYPYEVKYRTPDGAFSFQIMAISEEHAQLLVQDIRETAEVLGQIVKTFKA